MADDESEWRTPSHVGRKQRNKEKLQEKWELRLQTDPELIAAVELKKKKKKKEAKEVAKKEKKEQKEQKLKGAPIPDEATGAGWSREQLDNLLNKQKAPTKSKGKNKAKKPVAAAASSAASSSSRSQREDPTPAEQAQVPSDRIAEAFRSISGSPSLVSLRVLADSLEQLFGQQYNIALQRTDLTVLQGLPEEFVDPALEWLARVSEDDVARLLVSLVIPLSNKFSEDGKATSGSTGRGYQIFVQLVLRSVHAQRIFHDNAILAGGLPQNSKDPFFGWLHATLWQLQPRAAMFLAFQRNLATPPERQAELQRQVSREQDPTFITAYLKYAKNPDNVELNPKNFVLLLDFCASEDEKFRSSIVGALSSFLVSPETTYDDVAEVFEQLYQLRGSRLPNINNLFIALTDQLDQELPAPVVDRLREQFARFDFTNVRSFANHWSHLQNESLPIDNFILVVQQIQTNLQSLAAHIERITRRKLVFASISLVLLAALVFYLLIKRNLLPASFLKHFQQ